MPVPFWDDAPEAWDTLSLGSRTVPGLASVTGRAARKMDTRSRAGADGARVRDRGYEPAQLEINVKVWTAEQLAELTDVLAELHPRNVTQPPTSRQNRAQRELARERLRQAKLGIEDQGALGPLEEAAEAERNRPRPRARRTPVDIAHPATDLLGIRRVYVTGIKIPELRRGEFVTTISAIEWTPTPQVAPPPSTASAGSGLDDVQDAFTASRDRSRPAPDPPARVT